MDEAAFYYDDPMYRWLARNWADLKWSRGGGYLWMHNDKAGETVKPEVPVNYDGVRALPFDERLYAVVKDPRFHRGSAWTIGEEDFRLPPEPFEKAADCVAFRDGFNAQQAYLFLATSQAMQISKYAQNNSIARFTDLGDLWLFTNTASPTGWSRNLMSISNGKTYIPHAGCTVEALSNVGEVSAVSSKEEGVAGNDWTRTVVHWRGHYFVVLDSMQAREDDEYAYVCRWRTTQLASLQKGVWLATAPDGNTMRIQNTDPVSQTFGVLGERRRRQALRLAAIQAGKTRQGPDSDLPEPHVRFWRVEARTSSRSARPAGGRAGERPRGAGRQRRRSGQPARTGSPGADRDRQQDHGVGVLLGRCVP